MLPQFCGLLGSAALANNDRIGLLQFSDEVNDYLAPTRGRSQLMRCLSKVLMPPADVKNTSVNHVLKHLGELSLKRSIIVLISDFLTNQSNSENGSANPQESSSENSHENYQESLAILARKHEVLAIALDDDREKNLPSRGLFQLFDSENKQQQVIDCNNSDIREQYQQNMQERLKQRSAQFAHSGVDLLSHGLTDDPIETLLAFFHTRRQRVEGETGG